MHKTDLYSFDYLLYRDSNNSYIFYTLRDIINTVISIYTV
jgi:hypothetical protein